MTRAPKTQLHSLLLATSCLIGSSLLAVAPAMAGPTGGNIVSGSGTIHKSGGTTTIDQTSGKAFIDWNSFSIGANQTVKFDAPGKNSVTVNDVTGGDPTKIFGELLANGRIWLINGNGILFGKGSIVNVGSLIATTSDLSDDDFKKGKFRFKNGGNPNASVINKGTITASDGGYVVMSGAHVANEGVVQANLGKVVLGGADAFTVDLKGDNLIRYQITSSVSRAPTNSKGDPAAALVSNSGTIEANGGSVLMTSRAASSVQDNVINNTGMVEATSVSAHDGEVDFDAGATGTVEDSGTVDVAGRAHGETGGTVTMTGHDVVVADGARIDAQGHNGGGTVLIGGGFHGQGPLYQATNVTIGKAVINVNATHRGDGGKVAIWSTGNTSFAGTVDAKGGRYGGNGGAIETSGADLTINGSTRIETASEKGAAGSWLLDPSGGDVTIDSCSPTCGPDEFNAGVLASALDGDTAVTIEETSGAGSGINVDAAITSSSSAALSLLSEGFIDVEASIQNAGGGAINLVAGWDGHTGITGTATQGESPTSVDMEAILSTPNAFGSCGTISIGNGSQNNAISVGSEGGTTTVAAENLDITGGNDTGAQLGYSGNGGGNIVADLTGGLNLASSNGTVQIGNGILNGSIPSATSITGNITLSVAQVTSIQDSGSETAWIGNVADSGGTEKGNVSLVTGALTVKNGVGQGDNTLLGTMMIADLGTSSSTGGNFTLGFTDTTGSSITSANGDITISDYFAGLSAGALDYNSPHSLSLFSTNSLTVGGSIQNGGTGAVNLVSGWDGSTMSISTILSGHDYGAEGASILIGGANAGGDVAVGSNGGTTTIAGNDVSLDAENGYAQIGFNGSGGASGAITVDATGNVELDGGGNADYAQIGHGGSGSNDGGGAGSNSGNITVQGASVTLTAGSGDGAYTQIGHGGAATDQASGSSNTGNITVTATDGDIVLTGGSTGDTGSEQNDYAQIGMGGPFSGSDTTNKDTGNITLNASGNITILGGTDADQQNGFAIVGDTGTAEKTGNITVTAGGNITITGGSATGEPDFGGDSNSFAMIGDDNAGSITGNVKVTTGGDLALSGGGTGSTGDMAQIGDISFNSDVTGNLSVTVGSTLSFTSTGDAALIADLASGTASGTTLIKTADIDLTSDFFGDLGQSLGSDLNNGNTTLEITDSSANTLIAGVVNANSANTLKILATGSLNIESSIQNSGSGAIYLIGGWDGVTTTASKLTNSGVYGNNSGSIEIGDGSQTNAIYVGSEGGPVTVAAYDVKLKEGAGVPVQLGYHGNGGGNIVVDATDNLTLTANNTSNQGYVLIGNGDYLESNSSINNVTGNITVNVAKQTLLDASTVSGVAIGDFAYASGGTETGNVSLTTKDLSGTNDFANFIGNDLNGGNVTLEITDPTGTTTLPGTDNYSSANTLKILAEGSLVFTGDIQNSGSGAIDLVAGWSGTTASMASILANPGVDFGLRNGSITISPTFGTEQGAAVGSASGTTTVAADDVVVEGSGAGFAQIGYHGAGGGTIDVQATGDVTVESGTNGEFNGDGQIGNGNADGSGGNATGNITVNAGGNIEVEAAASDTLAAIGNVTDDAASSESGNITITAGDLVSLETTGDSSAAFIGNWSRDNTTGGASGNITVTSASLNVQTSTSGSEAVIGNGGQSGYSFFNAGDVSGDITIHTGTLTLTAAGPESDSGGGQARIGNRGAGAASGDITITSSGDTTLKSYDGDLASIGNSSYGATSTGNIKVTVGGDLTLLSNDTGITNIGGSYSSGTNVDVTVTGDILLKVTGNPDFEGSYFLGGEAVIGNYAAGKSAPDGNITVTSKHGSITLDSEEKYGSVQIGNTSGKATGSTITVTAADSTNGSIELLADNKYSFVQIGSRGANSASGSKVVVTAGADLLISGDDDSAVAQIGNGGVDMNGDAGGNLTVNVGGALTISSNGDSAAAVIGNGDPLNEGTGSASGNISVDVTGGADLVGTDGLVWIGNLSDTGVESGNVSIIARSGAESGGVDFDQMVIADLGTSSSAGSGGNVTVGFTNPSGSINFGGNFDYDSPNALVLLTAGSIDFTGSLQNSGAGDITVVAGWNPNVAPAKVLTTADAYGNASGSVTIGGAGATGNVDVGSAGGTTTVLADNVTLDSEHGYAQLGYHGNGTGDIDVDATGNITLTGNAAGGFVSQIGNGGSNVTGNVSGNITLTTTGGALDVDALGSSSIATIGALSDGGASNENGNISIDTHGGALSLVSSGSSTDAQIGDWTDGNNTGTLSSNITIHAGDINLDSTGANSSSQIGNGNYLGYGNSGAISGNIDVDATTLSVVETAPSGGFDEARIGNLGVGPVSGNLDVTTTGNITIVSNGAGAASIGNFSNPHDTSFNSVQGEGTGNVTVNSGGNISVSSLNGGFASIEFGGVTSGSVSVTALGNITETASSGSGALIGAAAYGNGGVNVSVTSKTGNVDVESNDDGSSARIGNVEYLTTGALDGNVTVTAADGNIIVAANGSGTNTVAIGDGGVAGGTVVGNIVLTAGDAIEIVNGTRSLIGNGGGPETGSVVIDAASLTGDITPSIENDLPGGDFTLTLTGNDKLILSTDIDYDSAHNLTLSNGGDIDFAGSVQNSGSGDITIDSAGTVLVGGTGASGNVSVGSAGGTTTVQADNVLVEADNGYAQIGFSGASGGNIDIVASGTITLDGGSNTSLVAQIGNGSTLDSSSAGGTIDLTAHSVNDSGSADIAGDSADIVLTGHGGHIGSASNPLGLAVNTLAILANGANAYLTSSQGLSIGVGADGIDLGSGNLTLVADGAISQTDAIAAGAIDIDATSGAITLTNKGNAFDAATLAASGNASLYDSSALTIAGANVGNTLTLVDAGSIGQSGAIDADTLDLTSKHGSITLTNTGNAFNTATLSASKDASLYDASDLTIAGATVGGTLTLAGAGNIGQSGAIQADTLDVTTTGGAIRLTNANNAVSDLTLSATGKASFYDSADLTVNGATVGGNLTLLTQGNLDFIASVQSKNGDILAVAGWDGTTTSPTALTKHGAYGDNGGSIIIGGNHASGDVAIGSGKGTTTLAGANVSLEADNGYAQIGYHGSGSGDIDVLAVHNVTLAGGGTGDYAQIGNGGFDTSGNESGNITVDARGDVVLDGGTGSDAYAQIGHGGADADKNSHGYTNSGNIVVDGQTVALVAGAGDQSYVQIGNGGYGLGNGLTGKGDNAGNITVTAASGVSLTGNGADAYAQIGNGGDQVNTNSGANASGSITGDIVVDVTGSGSVTLQAGAGDNAYVQIGNGGFSIDAPSDADAANFTISGSITVSDLTLTGSDTGTGAYAQVGNGDASLTGIGDVSGDITIESGTITLVQGHAKGAVALIGNAIGGDGTVTGTITGYTPPPPPPTGTTDPGTIVSLTAPTPTPVNQLLNLVIGSEDVPPPDTGLIDVATTASPNPLQQLADDSSYEGQQTSDGASSDLGRSLNGQTHAQTIIPGVLTELGNAGTPHGIPPADQNFSSWGNEALWRW